MGEPVRLIPRVGRKENMYNLAVPRKSVHSA